MPGNQSFLQEVLANCVTLTSLKTQIKAILSKNLLRAVGLNLSENSFWHMFT